MKKIKQFPEGTLVYPEEREPLHECKLPSTWRNMFYNVVEGCTWVCKGCNAKYIYSSSSDLFNTRLFWMKAAK